MKNFPLGELGTLNMMDLIFIKILPSSAEQRIYNIYIYIYRNDYVKPKPKLPDRYIHTHIYIIRKWKLHAISRKCGGTAEKYFAKTTVQKCSNYCWNLTQYFYLGTSYIEKKTNI